MGGDTRPTILFSEVYHRLYGAQRSLLQLYTELHRHARYRLHFAYITPGELSEAIADLGIPTTRLSVGPLLGSYQRRLLRLRWWDYPRLACELAAYAGRLKRLIRSIGADLMHCNNDRVTMMSFAGCRWAGCPVVTHMRRDRGFGWLDRLAYRGTTEMIWVSNRVRQEFGERNGITELKGRVIHNGRNLPDADGPCTREALVEEFGLSKGARLILMLAGFDERKDHETLVRSAAIACNEEPDLYYLLAGDDRSPDGHRFKEIKRLVAEAGLVGRVIFLGHRDDVSRLLRGVDLLVNSAREEALGGSLIEAIGYGVPCVATDTGGTSDIVPDGLCGYLVPRQDPVALARRTIELLRDDETRRTFSANARRHFADHFTLSRCVEETARFFDEIIQRRRARVR